MTLNGYIRGGQIVLEASGALPEGAPVRIQVLTANSPGAPAQETLGQRLMKHAGKAKGLPRDASRNHDHYLYGTPKR
jgi:hypothetical protein